ncbi:MAG: hypothetical protein QF535_23645, partial [Anaerolineales bacterium]|nr:hypothetical protein [Anaerolineales bacterium]
MVVWLYVCEVTGGAFGESVVTVELEFGSGGLCGIVEVSLGGFVGGGEREQHEFFDGVVEVEA